MITLTQLEYVVAVDEFRHFATAADKCFVTQPTLSMQIKKLEDDLGVIIFDRSRQPVVPTDIGYKLIEQARIVLASTQRIKEIINEENWGLKKLAYAIEKKSTGFYILMEFKAQPEVIKTLEVNFRRDEKVLRFLTIKMEKYAAEYAEKRRNNKSKKED